MRIAELLLETVEKEPNELRYEFGRWTGERLATYLAEQTGIHLSGSQVRRILKRKILAISWRNIAGNFSKIPKLWQNLPRD